MQKLAAFDLDGTLFDTVQVNFLAYQQVLAPRGYHLDFDFFRRECFGHDFGYFGPLLAPGADGAELERIHREKIARYPMLLGHARKNEHLFRMLHLMRGEYRTALVTVGSRENSTLLLREFGELGAFDLILTSEEIPRMKPDPACYRMAMEYFETDPAHTIIFEDSATGIAAARASGAQVFIVDGFH